MGALLDCFRGSTNEQNPSSANIVTPDADTRRREAAEAAIRRSHENERRGVDEDELRRMKQRQADRERIEEQQSKLSSDNNGGLRWQVN